MSDDNTNSTKKDQHFVHLLGTTNIVSNLHPDPLYPISQRPLYSSELSDPDKTAWQFPFDQGSFRFPICTLHRGRRTERATIARYHRTISAIPLRHKNRIDSNQKFSPIKRALRGGWESRDDKRGRSGSRSTYRYGSGN